MKIDEAPEGAEKRSFLYVLLRTEVRERRKCWVFLKDLKTDAVCFVCEKEAKERDCDCV